MNSQQYMKETIGDRMVSCINCGILMARMYEENGMRSNNTFWCGHCGLVIYKSVLGEWKTSHLNKREVL